jgi:hypothetical protein
MSILLALLYRRKSITLSKGSNMAGISARSLRGYAAAGSIPRVSESALKVGGRRLKVFKRWRSVQGLNSHGRRK